MARVICLVVVKNEADRHLADTLVWNGGLADGLMVFDDNSTDDSRGVARRVGARVVQAPFDKSFMHHEGQFRQEAWETLRHAMGMREGDWVLCPDADEFILGGRDGIEQSITMAIVAGCRSVSVPVYEVFGFDPDGRPLCRIDGWWSTIQGIRLAQWTGFTQFPAKRMASGSVPKIVEPSVCSEATSVLHYGYANELDRQTKYLRYRGLPGHSERHVESIMQTPITRRLEYQARPDAAC